MELDQITNYQIKIWSMEGTGSLQLSVHQIW
jgi:hypothetical protein